MRNGFSSLSGGCNAQKFEDVEGFLYSYDEISFWFKSFPYLLNKIDFGRSSKPSTHTEF